MPNNNKRYDLIYDYTHLQEWLLYSPLGREILRKERLFFAQNVAHIYGNYSIQIGLNEINLLHGNKIQNHYTINVDLTTDLRFLPFTNNSIDLIICPHVLEFTNNYHHVLQEFYRVLTPHGRIIITCFNKLSWFSLFKRRMALLKHANLISLTTLKSQLQALNFAANGGKFFSYCPPLSRSSSIRYFRWLDKVGDRWFPTLANSFALILRKEIVTPTLIKSKDTQLLRNLQPQFESARMCQKNN